MVRCRYNSHEDHTRIPNSNRQVNAFPERRFAGFSFLEGAPEDAGVVEHGAADDKGIAKMHARHCSERINVIATHPDARCVVVADGVEEAVLRRKQSGRHAWVKSEGHESEKICESEGAADSGEC